MTIKIMVNKRLFNLGILIFVILLAIIMMNFDSKEKELYFDEVYLLGYCPTMREAAYSLSSENGYELLELNSASEVLFGLRSGKIDKALIGRKAKLLEINGDVNKEVLKSGYTLVSSKRGSIEYSLINELEIHTYVDREVASRLIQESEIYYSDKDFVLEKIRQGNIALIPWEDWDDEFELIVVTKGPKKAKEFRGEFLYMKY